jgi:glycyl-tRNA synthetase
MGTLGEQVAGMEQMDKLVTLCKRRGFVFANAEVYSGLAGFWDYGPLGVELKRNIQRFWWDYMVRRRDNVVGLDAALIGPEAVWTASGHVGAFNDALVDDKNSKERFRIDQLLYDNEEDAEASEVYALAWLTAAEHAIRVWRESEWKDPFDPDVVLPAPAQQLYEEYARYSGPEAEAEFWDGLKDKLGYYPKNPNTGKDSRFTLPRQFNLMFKQGIGATGEAGQVGYLRAETCQPIFVDFEQTRVSSRQRIPFGIGQVGKAFRNEINPRNFLFRAREFSQMELEFFVRPDALTAKLKDCGAQDSDGVLNQPGTLASTMHWYDYWLGERRAYYTMLGIGDELLRVHDHPPEKLAHYAKAACDIEFRFPFGWGELEGVHHRGDFDLAQHQKHSGKKFEYFDDDAQQLLVNGGVKKDDARALATYIPVCIETSVGLDRTLLAVLTAAYDEDKQDTKHEGKAEDVRIVMRFHPRLAPVTCAVFPLSKKLSGTDSRAYALYRELVDAELATDYDDTGSIGKRYRRHDEVGTPWCITYDFESESDGAVTIRDRDSLAQDRVGIGEIVEELHCRLKSC